MFVVAALTGAALVGIRGPAPVRAENLGQRLVAGQGAISTLSARVDVIERGWHPEVPERRYTGRLTYRAPESLAIRLQDTTDYPSNRWMPNNVELVAVDAAESSNGVRPCPRSLQPQCSTPPVTTATVRRAPFDVAAPVPVDLVMPVASLGEHSAPRLLGRRTIAGEGQIGVAVTAAQIEPLLAGITSVGNWRSIHPADEAQVWLDDGSLTLRGVTVYAAEDAARQQWAAAEEYEDNRGEALLEISLLDVRTNAEVDGAELRIPDRVASRTDAGFIDTPSEPASSPGWLPEGMVLHRHGIQGQRHITTWSDGRAWLRLDETTRWRGDRLFGDLGEAVRRVALPGAGVAYVGQGGRAVALHGEERDVAVTGSVGSEALRRIAGSLGITGVPVPNGWRDSATTAPEAAARRLPGLLLPPPELEGFAEPAASVRGQSATLSFTGAGARSFVIVQRQAPVLPPPLDSHVVGVRVRGQDGRYTPDRGELEWTENAQAIAIRSETMGLPELLSVAQRLEPAP